MNRRFLVPAVAATLVLTAGIVTAEINAGKYPHMAAAQKHGKMAYDELNQVDHNHGAAVDSHVNKAKALLQQADSELEAAAAEANKTGK